MRSFLLLLTLIISINTFAQDENQIVTLTVTGEGKTKDEATQVALRSAIEQAFGTFISSKTEILDDELVRDEIVSISNGNIQEFEVISEVELPEIGYATTLKATVSVTKLTSFVESKGVAAEFKGGLFAFNINQQILNEKNEIKAIEEMCEVVKSLSDVSFNYTINANEPVAVNASNEKWKIPLEISVSANNNLLTISEYMLSTLKGLSLTKEEANDYVQLGKKVYPISFAANEANYSYIILRNEESIRKVLNQIYYFHHSILNFNITNGVSEWKITPRWKDTTFKIDDNGFRPLIYSTYCNRGVFYEINHSDYCRRNYAHYLSVTPIVVEENVYDNLYTHELSTYQDSRRNYASHRYTRTFIYDNQFSFIRDLYKSKIIERNDNIGLVISFIGININEEIIKIYDLDKRNIDEINKIKEYKIIPLSSN